MPTGGNNARDQRDCKQCILEGAHDQVHQLANLADRRSGLSANALVDGVLHAWRKNEFVISASDQHRRDLALGD